jgi:general secretion pathway protein K
MIGTVHRQGGFALLVVLWTLALLSLLGTYLVATARDRLALTRDVRAAAVLETAADGAVQHMIFELLDAPVSHWNADGTARTIRIEAVFVTVRLEDEDDKVNPNAASMGQLQALLRQTSPNPRSADALAAAIVDWRTPRDLTRPTGEGSPAAAIAGSDDISPGRPFGSLEELGLVSGMTPEILERLRPHLTLYAGLDPDLADGAVAVRAVRVVSMVAVARGAGKAKFARHVVVRTNTRRSGRRYDILESEPGSAGHEAGA